MRHPLTKARLRKFMTELARTAPRGQPGRVYLVGGGTAVWVGWRQSTVDIDLHGDPEQIFRDIQGIKERLQLNVEFARPDDFVPPLAGTEDRHLFIETTGPLSFYHHDPYAQVFSKVVRGFERDLRDAEGFVRRGMVDAERLRELVREIPSAAYAKYPALSRDAVRRVVDEFADSVGR
jgi:hypothetical protein